MKIYRKEIAEYYKVNRKTVERHFKKHKGEHPVEILARVLIYLNNKK